MKTSAIALIEVEILFCRGSAQKIETDSRKQLLEKMQIQLDIHNERHTATNLYGKNPENFEHKKKTHLMYVLV
ncbi:hypothetical protein NJT12_23280 [Flavobacterium sp. AC]|uniref:Uncharacterized protein n=1 Tax=Flavobacterium azizsancarii TaxID=2961580 RepID=A0ABT4WIX7_9FLAO|nr:hypothetical protein [Flavobacterium azizsancarii]MDA6072548.1 hypothetical protein [Flavobacterium azizsancarii]